MKFKKDDLRDLVDQLVGGGFDGFRLISQKITGHGRWSLHYRIIFEYNGKFYQSRYSTGATECQDESPYEYEDDEIECEEVVPVQKTITVYEVRRD